VRSLEDDSLINDPFNERVRSRMERAKVFEEHIDLEKLAYVFSSRRRLDVLLAIDERWLTQRFISKSTGISLSNLSPLIKGMAEKGLVECKSPMMRKNKVFTSSPDGHRVTEYVQEIHNAVRDGMKVTVTERELHTRFLDFFKRKEKVEELKGTR